MNGADWTNPDGRALVAVLYAGAGPRRSRGPRRRRAQCRRRSGRRALARRRARASRGDRCVDTALPAGRPGSARMVDVAVERDRRVAAPLAGRRRGGGTPGRDGAPRAGAPGASHRTLLDAPRGAPRGIAAASGGIVGGRARHVVGDDTKRALLAAMGLRRSTERSCAVAPIPRARTAATSRPRGLPCCRRRRHARSTGDLAAHAASRRALLILPPDACATAGAASGSPRISTRCGGAATRASAISRRCPMLATATARAGGSIVGINPLHALFAEDRERASPYHPVRPPLSRSDLHRRRARARSRGLATRRARCSRATARASRRSRRAPTSTTPPSGR